ncbi:AraC family transcriptional regulator [Undibacterium sp. Di27W]|uniref:AraC family transcriptional regulator n=1 Tax=Undibacterium sp. Di27W TaxID=3413036 RepID=UPI003BF39D3A
MNTDPLAEVVSLLQPQARYSKIVKAAGSWRVRRNESGQSFYCLMLEGSSYLTAAGQAPVLLQQGDFVLIPATQGFSMSSMEALAEEDADTEPVALLHGEFRLGRQSGPPEVILLVGHCSFAAPDAALLVSLLPQLVHIRGEHRLSALVQLISEESRAQRPAREVILAHLLEVLLIEALRSTAGSNASPGLLRGLADERLAIALRSMHENIQQPWTVAQLARQAALSRSTFFERFSRTVGITPMEYLQTWRMAKAKKMLAQQEASITEIAEHVGYGSASAFSVAFTRHVGMPPTHFAREAMKTAG